jgi:tRNA threonylcarbamoyladenosine biosynthesis protein TsaE
MHPTTFSLVVEGETETERLGARIALLLPPGIVICLTGTLGAGKTRLAKGIAAGLEIPAANVVSPTFSIANHHQGTQFLNHLDVYRIQDDDEFLELGVDEWFQSEAITLVEWGEKFLALLPENHLQICIEILSDQQRRMAFQSSSRELMQKIAALQSD